MMKTITVINPKPNNSEKVKRLKVAAYCRVSTPYEEQISSLESQIRCFTDMIQNNPDWEFAGVYAEQKSGTNIENRSGMSRMLKDCEKGKIDLILVKSISRFGRNTVDTLITLNHLAEKTLPSNLRWKV